MHADANYAIYWEPSGYSTSSAYKSIINGYFANVGAASGATNNDYSVATQYYDGAGHIAYSASSGGSTVDTNPFPASGCASLSGPCITDAQLQTELNKVVAAHGWPHGMGTMYFVYFPPNVTTCSDATGDAVLGQRLLRLPQLVGQRQLDAALRQHALRGVSGCESGQAPNGDTAADSELNVTSHENIEAITDPLGNAWYDASGQEIGDKCNFTFGSPLGGAAGAQYNEQIASGKYYLQEEWSNAASACAQRPLTAVGRLGLPARTSGTAGSSSAGRSSFSGAGHGRLVLGGPDRVLVGQRGRPGGILLGAGDELVVGLALGAGERARLHPEIDRLGVMGDDGQGRLLGLDGEAPGQAQADRRRVEQVKHLGQLGLLRARRIAPRVAATLGRGDAEIGTDAGVQPLGHALGGLNAETVYEQLLGKLPLGLQRGHQLGDLLAGGDRLQRDHVGLGAGGVIFPDRSRPGRCDRGEADAGTRAARVRAGWAGPIPDPR